MKKLIPVLKVRFIYNLYSLPDDLLVFISSRRVGEPQREEIRVICGCLIPRDHKIKRDLLNTNFTKIIKWILDK